MFFSSPPAAAPAASAYDSPTTAAPGYAAPAADSYGAPQAAPATDSYGSPQAAAVDSYGSPKAPAVDSYGSPKVGQTRVIYVYLQFSCMHVLEKNTFTYLCSTGPRSGQLWSPEGACRNQLRPP